MKSKRPAKSKSLQPSKHGFDGLLRELREFISESRRQVLRAVDVVQVRTCWGVGRHIVEFEQGGAVRAEYGAKLLPRLAVKLTEEFGRGFDASNLHKMKQFYIAFPILDALRLKLSWSHYRTLLRVEDEQAELAPSPREFVRDPVLLEFLGLPETGRLPRAFRRD